MLNHLLKIKTTLLSFCLIVVFSIQSYSVVAQKPVPAKIIAAKNNGVDFPKFNFIENRVNEDAGVLFYDKLSEYSLISLNAAALFEFRMTAPETFTLDIPFMDTVLTLELIRNEILTDDFEISLSDGSAAPEHKRGLFYNGMVKGNTESLVAVTIFSNHIMAVISTKQYGNIVIGKVLPDAEINYHIIYSDKKLIVDIPFKCEFNDEEDIVSPLPEDDEMEVAEMLGGGICVRVYFEVDHEMYLGMGGITETEDYIVGVFNNTETIFENDDVAVILSEIFIWTSDDPFPETDSYDALYGFQDYRTSFDGDVAILGAFDDGGFGGIAFLYGLCNPYRYSYVDMLEDYEDLPLYSFTVMAITHELGHNFGSHHTHWCGWDDGPIDNCGPLGGYGYETCDGCTCDAAPTPDEGTVMSYCHLVPDVGTNLLLGFGPQPGEAIRDYIADADCLEICYNKPDLTCSITDIFTDPIVPGSTISGICEVVNGGADDAAISKLNFYISSDCNLGLGDIFAGEVTIDPLLIDEIFLADIIADALVIFPGDYFLIAKADGNNEFEELNETNNTTCYPITILDEEALDMAVINTVSPSSSCSLSSFEPVVIAIKNFGTYPINEFILNVDITLDGVTTPWSSNIETTLLPGEGTDINAFIYDFSMPGEYILEASINIPGDADPSNNSITDTINSFGIELDPEINACVEVMLDAGNTGSDYLWNTGENTQTILVMESGTYSVIVTTPDGECVDTAVTFVTIDPAPIAGYTYVADFLTLTFTNTSEYEDGLFWDFGDGFNSTEENPVHIYAVEGDYNVSLTASNHCDDDVASEVISLDDEVGINDGINNIFLIYPNPADEMIILECSDNIDINDISIFNMMGQQVQDPEILNIAQDKFSIKTSALITGAYYIQMRFENHLYNVMMLVEH